MAVDMNGRGVYRFALHGMVLCVLGDDQRAQPLDNAASLNDSESHTWYLSHRSSKSHV